MARTLSGGRKSGDCVYHPYRPMTPGIILEAQQQSRERITYQVRWWDGTISWHDDLHLNDFDALIEEHRKKYERFADMRAELWKHRNAHAKEKSDGPKP